MGGCAVVGEMGSTGDAAAWFMVCRDGRPALSYLLEVVYGDCGDEYWLLGLDDGEEVVSSEYPYGYSDFVS